MKTFIYIHINGVCMNKSLFLIILVALSACDQLGLAPQQNTTVEPKDENKLVLPAELSQWAASADASVAYGGVYGDGDWTPASLLGPPDVEACEDNGLAWAPEHEDDGLQWIELTYENPVYLTQVKVRESSGPGAVTTIEALTDGDYVTIWEGTDRTKTCPGDFIFRFNDGDLNKTDFKTDTLRINLNTDVKGWNEVDAVQLTGYPRGWHLELQGNITVLVYDELG
jgi:hypothetical protein